VPTPTMLDMTAAMEKVWDRWGSAIPSALKKYRAADIVIFAGKPQWDFHFTHAYVRVFRPANQFAELPRQFIDGVLGFVTPIARHQERKIYLSPKAQGFSRDEQRMILSHEYIHWLSHASFYPEYYAAGGMNPFRVEGITQWLTVECGYHSEFRSLPAYQDEHLKTSSWLAGNKRRRQEILDFAFAGKNTSLKAIRR
jgi:hypothetical protein